MVDIASARQQFAGACCCRSQPRLLAHGHGGVFAAHRFHEFAVVRRSGERQLCGAKSIASIACGLAVTKGLQHSATSYDIAASRIGLGVNDAF